MSGLTAITALVVGLQDPAKPRVSLVTSGGVSRVAHYQSDLSPGAAMELARLKRDYHLTHADIQRTAEQLPTSLHGSSWNRAEDLFLTAAYLTAYKIPVDQFVARAKTLPVLRTSGGWAAPVFPFSSHNAGSRARVAIECLRNEIDDAELARLAEALPPTLSGSSWTSPGDLGLVAIRVKAYGVSVSTLCERAAELGRLSTSGGLFDADIFHFDSHNAGQRGLVALETLRYGVTPSELVQAARSLPIRYAEVASWSGPGDLGKAAIYIIVDGRPAPGGGR